MKTLLKGGPLDGRVIQTERNEYGFSQVEEVRNKDDDSLVSRVEVFYQSTYKREPHPAMKRGKIRVFTFCEERPKWARDAKAEVR